MLFRYCFLCCFLAAALVLWGAPRLIAHSPKVGHQPISAHQGCGTEQYRQQEEKKNPNIKKQRAAIERQTQRWIRENAEKLKESPEVITIPVVVHIVHNPAHPEQNISNEQVFSQIDALNRDFRRLNADTTNTPQLFQPVAADTEIMFRLARRTPERLPTNGITRTPTNVNSFTLEDDNVKYDNSGGKNIWNRDQYLNIWVCNLEPNYLGYAQYPGGLPATDGIVISYKNFGTTGTVSHPYNKGRTAAHEVGHWLNLLHTWGDEDNCDATDYVADTPTQESAYHQCPSFPQVSCGSEDMFMNYMDYTHDHCTNIFTNGQKNRMHATLHGFRAPLKNSVAFQEPDMTALICDTLNQELLHDDLYLYELVDNGFIAGTNILQHRAKAQFFDDTLDYRYVTGASIAFGAAYDAGGELFAAVWEKTPQGVPEPNPVAIKKLSLSQIESDVAQNRRTHFDFHIPAKINGPFFTGIILPDSTQDTIAILASEKHQDVVNAWDQRRNYTWVNFEENWVGSFNVNLAVFPVACKLVPSDLFPESILISVGPNPSHDGIVNLYFSNYNQGEEIDISIYDITGRRIFLKTNQPLRDAMTLELKGVNATGLFLIRMTNKNINLTKKIIFSNKH